MREAHLGAGLTALARASGRGPVHGHWGAALLAGYFLARRGDLGRLGHPDLARRGHGALRASIRGAHERAEKMRTEDGDRAERLEPAQALSFAPTRSSFWARDWSGRFGWAAGHVFKYSHALHELLPLVDDASLAERACGQMGLLLSWH